MTSNQFKLPDENTIDQYSNKNIVQIYNNLNDYINNGESIPFKNVSKYSNIKTYEFIKYLDDLEDTPIQKIKKIYAYIKNQSTLPNNYLFSDNTNPEFIPNYLPINRHIDTFEPNNFNFIHEEILSILSQNLNNLEQGSYYKNKDTEPQEWEEFKNKYGELHTPTPDCFLDGITRRCIIDIAKWKGIKIVERKIKPEEMTNFAGCFLTGTAAEVTPVSQIDKYKFTVCNVIKDLSESYQALVRKKTTA